MRTNQPSNEKRTSHKHATSWNSGVLQLSHFLLNLRRKKMTHIHIHNTIAPNGRRFGLFDLFAACWCVRCLLASLRSPAAYLSPFRLLITNARQRTELRLKAPALGCFMRLANPSWLFAPCTALACLRLVGKNSTRSVPASGASKTNPLHTPVCHPLPPRNPLTSLPAATTAKRLHGPAGNRGLIFPGRTIPWTALPPRGCSESPAPSGTPPARGPGRRGLSRTCPPTPSLATPVLRGRCRRFRGGRSPLPGDVDFASKPGGERRTREYFSKGCGL